MMNELWLSLAIHQPICSSDGCETTQFLETHSEAIRRSVRQMRPNSGPNEISFSQQFRFKRNVKQKPNENWKETIYPNVWRQAVHWNVIVQSITISGSSIRYIFNSCVCVFLFFTLFRFCCRLCCCSFPLSLAIAVSRFSRFDSTVFVFRHILPNVCRSGHFKLSYVEHMLLNSRTSNNSHSFVTYGCESCALWIGVTGQHQLMNKKYAYVLFLSSKHNLFGHRFEQFGPFELKHWTAVTSQRRISILRFIFS